MRSRPEKRAGQKRGHMNKDHNAKQGNSFWNKEYKKGEHFSLSDQESAELVKFMKWMKREEDHIDPSQLEFIDVGCGNGRNSVYLSRNFRMKGVGFDLAASAIESAQKLGQGLPIRFFVHNLCSPEIPLPDQSADLVIDLMVSHCLRSREREAYHQEMMRILRPEGYIFIKTFLREGDEHAKRMIREHPGGEEGSYIHPMIGIFEHTWTENEFVDFWGNDFNVRLLHKSHGYQRWGGQPYKRRYMVAYLQKK
jgi:SAM-dependent methyltransferase